MVAHTQNGITQQQPTQTALAPRSSSATPTPFEPENLAQAEAMADRLARSSLLPAPLRGKPADVFLTLLVGRDLGLSAATSLTKVHIIEGKPSLSADLAVGLVKKSPVCLFFRLVESTDAIATYETERRNEGKTSISFTIEQARNAGVAGKDNWRKFPAAMLRARASMALARAVYPDVLAGVYDPDELGAEAAPMPVEAERVRAPAPAATVASPPAEQPKRAQPEAIDAEFTQAAPEKPADEGAPTIFEQLMAAFDAAEQALDETARRNAVTATNRHKKVGDITPDEAAQLAARAAAVKAKINPEAPAQTRTEAVKQQMQQQAEEPPPPPPPAE